MSEADDCLKEAPAAAPTYVEQQPTIGDLVFTTEFRADNQLVVARVVQTVLCRLSGCILLRVHEVYMGPYACNEKPIVRDVSPKRVILVPAWYKKQMCASARADHKKAGAQLDYLTKITKNE